MAKFDPIQWLLSLPNFIRYFLRSEELELEPEKNEKWIRTGLRRFLSVEELPMDPLGDEAKEPFRFRDIFGFEELPFEPSTDDVEKDSWVRDIFRMESLPDDEAQVADRPASSEAFAAGADSSESGNKQSLSGYILSRETMPEDPVAPKGEDSFLGWLVSGETLDEADSKGGPKGRVIGSD